MRACPVYAYDLTGKFAFEASSQTEMAKLLGARQQSVSEVCNNTVFGFDNGCYTCRNHYLKLYKKDQLTEEEMMPESRKKKIEAVKRARRLPRRKRREVEIKMTVSKLKELCEKIEKAFGSDTNVIIQIRDINGVLINTDYASVAFIDSSGDLFLTNYEQK